MEIQSMRDAFGEAITAIAEKNQKILALTADLADSVRLTNFKEKFPDRFVNVGVAEANLVGVSAGLALEGFIPFACSFAVFVPGRCFDQIRVSVCQNRANVKLIGSHAGLSNPGDGMSAQSIGDLALMRVLPGMAVVAPADANQTKQAVEAMTEHSGPVYLRIGREPLPNVTDGDFEIGKAQVLRSGKNLTIIACGSMVEVALRAAEEIDGEVINMHTIKPLDGETLLNSIKKTGGVITVEEHSVIGGLGSAVAEFLSQNCPVPIRIIGIEDRFGQSARTYQELLEEYGLTKEHIVSSFRELIK